MSEASEAFSATDAIASGRWDQFLLPLGLAINTRLQELGTSIPKEVLHQFEISNLVRSEPK